MKSCIRSTTQKNWKEGGEGDSALLHAEQDGEGQEPTPAPALPKRFFVPPFPFRPLFFLFCEIAVSFFFVPPPLFASLGFCFLSAPLEIGRPRRKRGGGAGGGESGGGGRDKGGRASENTREKGGPGFAKMYRNCRTNVQRFVCQAGWDLV